MRALLFLVLVVLSLNGALAKLKSVSGRGYILPTPPPNVLSAENTNDTPSATILENGVPVLAVTAFDEKQGVVLDHDLIVSDRPAVTLKAGVAYDSAFIFFHQKRLDTKSPSVNASAVFTIDNRFVGCTLDSQNNAKFEIATTPFFGLAAVQYPTEIENGRNFEPQDGLNGAGTTFATHHAITQPGDYVRCFSASCIDANGQDCQCSASFTPMCLSPANNEYACFSDVAALLSTQIGNNSFHFSSTCIVDIASVVGSVQQCDASNGCKVQSDGSFCLKSSPVPSFVDLHITAGCGCDKVVRATFQGTASSANCFPADTPLDPPATVCGNENCQTVVADCHSGSAHATASSGNCVSLQFNC